eukprot:TRINITY_DN3113_c0_g7_i1.p1 TRINITY_DN3113_c0_g7~~TRINITY_DN3113_c0_g7_i1.p1  ORF type:complete len:220 (-),score=42.19 TRINITY_DN3113_c0_g7_i1:449-1108(-)
MIELDKVFAPVCKVLNNCYEAVFLGFPRFPKFSFVRVMTILWRDYVYAKIAPLLLSSFIELMKSVREAEIGAFKKNLPKELLEENLKSRNLQLLGRFVQAIADLSINELSIHYLGSTKVALQNPYLHLHSLILRETKYFSSHRRNHYRELKSSMDLESFKELLKIDRDAMKQQMLPVTLKEIEVLRQAYMEKYLRGYVKSRLCQFVENCNLIVYSLYIT